MIPRTQWQSSPSSIKIQVWWPRSLEISIARRQSKKCEWSEFQKWQTIKAAAPAEAEEKMAILSLSSSSWVSWRYKQGRLPEDEEHDNVLIQPREVGLDRVPTRLSSSDLEGRRQEEEENIQNLVDEVLNTSSEVDFVLGNSDQLHSPK